MATHSSIITIYYCFPRILFIAVIAVMATVGMKSCRSLYYLIRNVYSSYYALVYNLRRIFRGEKKKRKSVYRKSGVFSACPRKRITVPYERTGELYNFYFIYILSIICMFYTKCQ